MTSLHDRVSEGVNVALRLQWAKCLVNTITSFHSVGVLHRDISPGNLFVDDEDNIYVGDFGNALVDFDARKRRWGFRGTRSFASENCLSRGEPRGWDDFESVCWCLYWMADPWLFEHLKARPPFRTIQFYDQVVSTVLAQVEEQVK